MKLITEREVFVHLFDNGLPSKIRRVVVPDPEPFNRLRWEENQKAKHYSQMLLRETLKRSNSFGKSNKICPPKTLKERKQMLFAKANLNQNIQIDKTSQFEDFINNGKWYV
jgi:hypothetical protein